jgi:hypothetical protein
VRRLEVGGWELGVGSWELGVEELGVEELGVEELGVEELGVIWELEVVKLGIDSEVSLSGV